MIGQARFLIQKRYLRHADAAGIISMHADREGSLLWFVGAVEASHPLQGAGIAL
jgi:hypothetical protein